MPARYLDIIHAVKYFHNFERRRDGNSKKCRNEEESRESYVAAQVMMVCDYKVHEYPLKSKRCKKETRTIDTHEPHPFLLCMKCTIHVHHIRDNWLTWKFIDLHSCA